MKRLKKLVRGLAVSCVLIGVAVSVAINVVSAQSTQWNSNGFWVDSNPDMAMVEIFGTQANLNAGSSTSSQWLLLQGYNKFSVYSSLSDDAGTDTATLVYIVTTEPGISQSAPVTIFSDITPDPSGYWRFDRILPDPIAWVKFTATAGTESAVVLDAHLIKSK